jgi:hypothetical protein
VLSGVCPMVICPVSAVDFNFAIFSVEFVTVIVLTFKIYKINNKRRIQCCLQWTENRGQF